MNSSISTAVLEQAEAENFAALQNAATDAAKAALGMRELRIGGGIATAVPVDPTGYWSKALGLGWAEPVTVTLVERIIRFYRDQGMTRAAVAIAPQALPPDWADVCAKLGLTPGGLLVKLAGDLGAIAGDIGMRGGPSGYLDSDLRIEGIGIERAREWATFLWGTFGFPIEHQVEMAVGTVGKPDWRAFAVFAGDEIVAASNLRISDGIGHLIGAVTSPRARGRGAQSAMIAARALAARAAGCDWLMGETGAEVNEPNPSLHNMVRLGMSVRYTRRNWIWQAAAVAPVNEDGADPIRTRP